MSPDKVSNETPASSTDHSIVIISNNTAAANSTGNNSITSGTSNGSNSNSSSSGDGDSSSSPVPTSDRNNNIQQNNNNNNNNNNNSVTGSGIQSNAIFSVIQPPQSVIISTTAAGAAAVQQLKHVLVSNSSKQQQLHHPGSVIQSTGESAGNDIQLISSRGELDAKSIHDDESKKRREVLERRPSYRKILNDLSSAEVSQIVSQFQQPDIKHDPDHHPAQHHQHPQQQQHSPNSNSSAGAAGAGNSTTGSSSSNSQQSAPAHPATITVATSPYLKVVPTSTIQLAGPGAGSPDGLPGLSALAVNPGSASAATIVQYGQDGQPFFVPVSAHYANGGHSFNSPVTVSAADLHTYQLGRSGGAGGPNSQQLTSSVMMASPNMTGHVPGEVQEVSKKREMRLLKNREAAKECRRKKKEYIKCLENRVAVLENQNKALIDELKSLKELYCSNKND